MLEATEPEAFLRICEAACEGSQHFGLATLFCWRERTTAFSSNLLHCYFGNDVVVESARKLEIRTQILEHVHRATVLCLCSQVLCTHLPLNTDLIGL